MALPAILLQIGAIRVLLELNLPLFLLTVLKIFVGIAFVEEFLKYLVVKEKVLKNSEFDEPVDAMIYMIIAALGFAAAENILVLFSLSPSHILRDVFEAFTLSVIRFWGATFLHALCSGALGYFLALSIYNQKSPNFGKKNLLLIGGLSLATLLHGIYNFSIMELEGKLAWLIPVIVLVSLAIFLTFAFQRLKKLKSVCKI